MSDKHPEIECYECGRLKTRLIWNSRCVTCTVQRLEFNLEENDTLRSQLAAIKEENKRLKARVAELAAPAVQGEPVAALLIGEPEYTKQGWEPGDWDIEPNATTIEAFAKLVKPGAYQLYLAPQPAEQKPAPDVAGLVEALECALEIMENVDGANDCSRGINAAEEALAAHRKHGGRK